jgi:hypothetical protein
MPDKKLKKGHDSIHWLIWNDCEDRPVLLCVYATSPMAPENPFDKCHGGDIGTPFVAKKGLAPTIVSCKAKSDAIEGKYTKQALVGTEIPASKQCPPSPLPEPTPKGTVKTLAHTLDIVIEP